MYWYLSFLRPPSVSATAGGSVTITPQIANDLRTELFLEPTEIHYTWQRVSPGTSTSGTPHAPQPLTRWDPPASTYLPVEVPLPRVARAGERWRLGLHTRKACHQDLQDLLRDGDESPVLSVWSEAIDVLLPDKQDGAPNPKRAKKNAGAKDSPRAKEAVKQTRISREFALPRGQVNEAEQVVLRVVEQTSFDLDKKVWDSGLALSAWFWRELGLIEESTGGEEVDTVVRAAKGRVLELGSGTGLVGIALRLALGKASGEVITTDLDSAIELMEENIALNALHNIRATVLDWDEALPDWVATIGAGADRDDWPDLVVAADVTYNTASFPMLIKTITALLAPSSTQSKKRPPLLLAYKQRDVGERELWSMLRDKGVEMRLIDKVRGAAGAMSFDGDDTEQNGDGVTEIWLGRYIGDEDGRSDGG